MALIGSLGAGVANTNIGFTPANAAGQTFTNAISALTYRTNYDIQGNITPAAPWGNSLGTGLSMFSIANVITDNTYRTIFSNMTDFCGFIFVTFGDQPVKDSALYYAALPSVPYGVYNLTQIGYYDTDWPSGTFAVQRAASGNSQVLQIKHASYYANNLAASGTIAFLKLN